MKGRRVPIFAIAIALSGLFHAGLYTGARNVPIHALSAAEPGSGANTIGIALLADGAVKDDSAALVQGAEKPPIDDPAAEPEEPPPVEPPDLPPTVVPPNKPEVEKFPDKLGVYDGTGIGSHKAEGSTPMKASLADSDQPFLSRDPRGPGKIADPADSTLLPGQNGAGGPPGGGAPQDAVVLDPAPPRPMPMPKFPDAEVGQFRPGPIELTIPTSDNGVATDADKLDAAVLDRGPLTPARAGVDVDTADPEQSRGGVAEVTAPDQLLRSSLQLSPPPPARIALSPPPAPLPLRLPPSVAAPMTPEPPAIAAMTVTQPQPRPGAADTAVPGPPVPAADAAQESESEVDPFSKIDAVVRRDGRVDPQFGREVKTVRPKIPIVGLLDAAQGARRVTLKVRVGVDGKVTSVNVFRSSGSNEIDQPCLVAMYDWWFEPLRDKRGQPVPDTLLFTLNFR